MMQGVRRVIQWDVLMILSALFLAMMLGILVTQRLEVVLMASLMPIAALVTWYLLSHFGHPIYVILAIVSLGTIPSRVNLGNISVSAMLTVLISAGLFGYIMLRKTNIDRIDFVGIMFLAWALSITFARNAFTIEAIQNFAVYSSFFAMFIVTRNQIGTGYTTVGQLNKALQLTALTTSILFWLQRLEFAGGAPRSYALIALMLLCWFSARMRTAFSVDGAYSIGLLLSIGLTLSRTALVTAVLVIVLSRIDFWKLTTLVRTSVLVVVAGYFGVQAIYRISSLNRRFFTGDTSLAVGGVRINAMGRTELWNATLDSITQTAATSILGQGLGSSMTLIRSIIPSLGHPHNEFLRLWHDTGLLGLGLWLLFMMIVLGQIIRCWNLSELEFAKIATLRAGLLIIVALIPPMFTDNIIVYYYVMLPTAVILGTASGSMNLMFKDTSRMHLHSNA